MSSIIKESIMNNTAEMFNAAAVATRVATVMQVIGGIPSDPQPNR